MMEDVIVINDLNAWITPKLAEMQRPHDVHYLDSGSDYLGQKVAAKNPAGLGHSRKVSPARGR
jgi:acyl-CoA thioesterase-1